jgi:hypothetical protein
MRTIKKCGGLDQYVCGDKPARIKELGLLGWRLRWLVMTSPKMQAQYSHERRELGLEGESPLVEAFEDVWNDPERRQKLVEQQELAWSTLRDAAKRFEQHVRTQWVENGEKHDYDIPTLGTLENRSPSQEFFLPAQLPEVQEEFVVEDAADDSTQPPMEDYYEDESGQKEYNVEAVTVKNLGPKQAYTTGEGQTVQSSGVKDALDKLELGGEVDGGRKDDKFPR